MAWCTVADVQALTGRAVQESDVDMATGVIELTSGGQVASLDSTILSARNLDWLRRAVAYQAAFMTESPDYFTRMDVSQITQDGTSATIKADGLVLAPLARRCLKRLSWRGMRTVHPTGRTVDPDRAYPYTSDDYDDAQPWKPL